MTYILNIYVCLLKYDFLKITNSVSIDSKKEYAF